MSHYDFICPTFIVSWVKCFMLLALGFREPAVFAAAVFFTSLEMFIIHRYSIIEERRLIKEKANES